MVFGSISRGTAGSFDRATQVTDNITGRFWFLAVYPYTGRSRDHDLAPGLRSFPVENYVILYQIVADGLIDIVHVFDGRRDIPALFHEGDEE